MIDLSDTFLHLVICCSGHEPGFDGYLLLLAGLMFLITIAGWMFGISAGAETLRLLAVAFVVFIIPHIAEWLIIRIVVINYGLRDFIKS